MPKVALDAAALPSIRVAVVLPLRGGHLSAITSRSSQPYRGHFGQPCCPTLWCRRRRARTPLRRSCSSAPTTTKALPVPSHIGAQWPATAQPAASAVPTRTSPPTRPCKCTTLSLWATASSASTGRVRRCLSLLMTTHPTPTMGIQSVSRMPCGSRSSTGGRPNRAVSFLTATRPHQAEAGFHRQHG